GGGDLVRVAALVGQLQIHGRIPAAGVPLPVHAGVAEPVADVRFERPVRVVRVAVVDRVHQRGGARRDETGHQVRREGGVDRVLAVDGQVAVLEGLRGRVPAGQEAGGDRLVPLRGGGGDQELVVEERAAVGRVEEVVVHRVLLGEQALGEVTRVEE